MFPSFLLPESVARDDGHGPEMAVGPAQGKPLLLTLGITRILEQESLDVTVWGSADGRAWQPLAAFPPKSYCGTYSLLLDLSRHRDMRYLRAHWRMGRWSRAGSQPLFGFSLYAETAKVQVAGAA